MSDMKRPTFHTLDESHFEECPSDAFDRDPENTTNVAEPILNLTVWLWTECLPKP